MSTPGELPRPAGHGRGPVIAVGIAALALVVLLIPGVLLSVGDGAQSTTPRASEAERQLEGQIKEFERRLAEDVCRAEPQTPTLRPPGSGQGGSPPPGEDSGKSGTAPPPYALPVVPGRVPVPEGVAPGQTTRPASLADLLDRTTVLVITDKGLGSGFFVAPNLVLTNAHVIDGAGPVVRVGNKAMPRMIEVQVVARTTPARPGDIDYALLKLPANQTLGHLTFAEGPPAKLQNVVAAGYPGFVTKEDPKFQRLVRGDLTAIPDSSLTQGAVMVVQSVESPNPIVVHRASISGGNSGGPLADECGRVLGVNTFGGSGEKTDHQNFALGSKSALAFLKQNGVTPQIVAGECVIAQGPSAPTPAPTPAPKPGAGPTPAPAPAPAPAPGAGAKPGGDKGK